MSFTISLPSICSTKPRIFGFLYSHRVKLILMIADHRRIILLIKREVINPLIVDLGDIAFDTWIGFELNMFV